MSDIARYRLVLFAPPVGADHAVHGRRLAEQIEDTGETGAAVADREAAQAQIDGLVSALKTHFTDADVHRYADDDEPSSLDVSVSADAPTGEVEWEIAADFVELLLWSTEGQAPAIDAATLELLTRDAAGAGYSTIFDPQLDRIVTVGEAHEISEAWAGELQEASAQEASNAGAQAALGRGERPGLLSRLFGRG